MPKSAPAADPAPTVRAKFAVTEERRHVWNGAKVVVLTPQYDQSIPEDRRFHDATPSGHFEMTINNPKAVEALMPEGKLGKEFYIDLTPVPEPEPPAA